jgi:two-component system, cell cycle sensor histidine kinase and response regulator CckA
MSAAAQFPFTLPDEEQRLRRAASLESVGRLAAGVAHDFNNLLTGILLYCDLLLATLEQAHRGRKYAEEIRGASLQGAALIRQLLAVTRPGQGEAVPLCLNSIIEGMCTLLRRLIGETIELQCQLDLDLGLVEMIPAQAQQILLNLVLNARDALPSGGQIRVETRNCRLQVLTDPQATTHPAASFPCVLFTVADDGCGMDAETRAHLFEPLFTTKEAGKGTGLGMATVHDIVARLGGLLHVESHPARGTRVTVVLPSVSWEAENFGANPAAPASIEEFRKEKEKEE